MGLDKLSSSTGALLQCVNDHMAQVKNLDGPAVDEVALLIADPS